ncbi:MAG TPA: DUF6259 domain-containing protein, partial [Armatimonadota bacterium]|nr:DUF6259 domain-containing protein [Armatimonadota bacterium]
YLADLTLDSSALTPVIAGDEDGLSLTYTAPVPGGLATVTLRVTGGEDAEELRFTFGVHLPEDWAVKRAAFPRIRGFGDYAAPDDDALLYPENWGVLRRNPLADMTDFAGQYPGSVNWCQMMAWFHGAHGLYVGVLDPDSHFTGLDAQYVEGEHPAGWRHFWDVVMPPLPARAPLDARLSADPAMQLRVNHWPEMRHAWTCPYPVVLRGFTGDWFDAGHIHRAWATRQRWCRRGLLAERDDASVTLASLDLWFIRYAFPAWARESAPAWDFQRAMHKLLDFFGAPFGIHWYHWHDFSWHTHYPAHFPVQEGFVEVLDDLQSRGVVVMPYCQGRLLYRDRPTFATDRAHATVEAHGQPYLEKYTDQDDWPLALCPADRWARMQWWDTARTLWRHYGTDGVYFDQITAMGPSLCYHAGHGHPLGGGAWYWQGYDDALGAMAPMIAEDPDRFLSSELLSDAFMDRIDLYLSFVPPIEDYVPLHPAIYSGYTTVMGRSTPEAVMADPQLFVIEQGEQFLFGGQLGWMHDAILDHPEAAAFLRDLVRLRAQVRAILHFGIMQRPLEMTVSGAALALDLSPACCGKERPVALERPAVRNTVWQSPDGDFAVLLLNEAT